MIMGLRTWDSEVVLGEPGFLCACSLDQTQLSEEVTQMLRTLKEDKPHLLIFNRR